ANPDEAAAFAALFDDRVCPGGCTPTRSNPRPDNGATVSDLTIRFAAGGTGAGLVRAFTQDSRDWWQIEVSPPSLTSFNQPIFEAIDRTFTTSPTTQVEEPV